MSRWTHSILVWAGAILASTVYVYAGALPPAPLPQAAAARDDASDLTFGRALVDRYCVTCHNARTKTADLALDTIDMGRITDTPEIWEKVVRKLRDGAMPPSNVMNRPDKASYDRFARLIETRLDAGRPNPGRPVVHRLNRVEYANAIRDLLALDVDAPALLPADESGYGFDNIADVLSISPALLERYMFAAQRISALATGDPAMKPLTSIYRTSPAEAQDRRMSIDLPFRSRGGTVVDHYFPVDGEYVIKLRLRRAFSNAGTNGYNTRERIDVRLDGTQVKLFTVGGDCAGARAHEPQCIIPPGVQTSSEYSIHLDDGLEVKLPVKAGKHRIGVSFAEASAAAPEGGGRGFGGGGQSIDRVIVEGPLAVQGTGDTPSRRRIYSCTPSNAQDESACAEKILSTLARRAYRRPVTQAEVAKLVAFYNLGKAEGGFDSGIRLALERLLVSPNFLLRVERDPSGVAAGAAYRLSDLELASRLSFFLWSSIPDDDLVSAAAAGKLRDPKVLEQQVRRMLADERSNQLVTNFAAQWLYLRDLKKLVPDPGMFPEFNDNLRKSFQTETELFLANELGADHPVPQLLTANYTFANEQLAKFYGYPHVYGTHFRRVEITDPNRFGLLGHGSLLTVTSYATRTSAVQRGKYIMTNILGTPPPPPPPNIPPLPETGARGEPVTMREKMALHRTNAVCASCHSRMDPLGFALENFNAIGKWRTTDGEAAIDPSGVFPDGTKFANPSEFRNVLLAHRDQFVRTFAEKMLTYALGRGLEYYDSTAVRAILRDAAPGDYRWSSVILGVVKSVPFQMRTATDGRMTE